jgi:hypothetical protein
MKFPGINFNIVLPALLFAAFLLGWLVTLARLAPVAWQIARLYLVAPGIEATDITHLDPPPPPGMETFTASLGTLGFRRLGVRQAHLPGLEEPITVWMLVDAPGTTYAEATCSGPDEVLAVFATCFEDGAYLETDHSDLPESRSIEKHDYSFESVSGTVKAAYENHLRRLHDMSRTHSQPRLIESMADYRVCDVLYRNRHIRTKLFPDVRRWVIVPLATTGYVLGLCACLLGPGFVSVWKPRFSTGEALLIGAALLLPAVLANRAVMGAPAGE